MILTNATLLSTPADVVMQRRFASLSQRGVYANRLDVFKSSNSKPSIDIQLTFQVLLWYKLISDVLLPSVRSFVNLLTFN